MADVLTQARTPTEAEIKAADNATWEGWSVEQIAEDVLHVAAPRILALAYREAARECVREAERWEGKDGPISAEARLCAIRIEALATALEEGTPNE